MENKKLNTKAPLFSTMHIALLLLCAVLLSAHSINGLYARYISKSTGSSSARVIRFGDITLEEPADNNFTLAPGVTAKNEVKLSFEGSESATYVFVAITTSNHWTFDTTAKAFKINANSKEIATLLVNTAEWTYLTTDGGKVVFYKALDPNVPLSNNQIFVAQNGVAGGVAVDSATTAFDLSKLSGKISISVKAIAVQSIGFATVTDAWNSVKTK